MGVIFVPMGKGEGSPTSVCPSGYLKWDCRFGHRRQTPPSLAPTNMAVESTILPAVDIMGVMPVLKPTVPMALTCSKAKSKKVQALAFNIADCVKVNRKTPTRFRPRRTAARCTPRAASLMVRLKIWTWSAHEPSAPVRQGDGEGARLDAATCQLEEAPMNMSTKSRNSMGMPTAPMSTVLKPLAVYALEHRGGEFPEPRHALGGSMPFQRAVRHPPNTTSPVEKYRAILVGEMVFQGCVMRSRSLDVKQIKHGDHAGGPKEHQRGDDPMDPAVRGHPGWANPSVNRVMPALLKAETLWNTDENARSAHPENGTSGLHNAMSATAPRNSRPRHHSTTLLRVPLLPRRLSVFTKSSMTSCCFTATPNLDARAKKDPNAMKFSPPNWMSTSSTQCPLCVKYVMVSTLINPVTQVALVAVNKASATACRLPPWSFGACSAAMCPLRSTRGSS